MARDTQQRKVYEWEWACIRPLDPTAANAASRLSLDECQQIVGHAFCEFAPDASPPAVNSPHTSQRKSRDGPACFRRDGRLLPLDPSVQHAIILPDWARTSSVVLHEAAHALTFALVEEEFEGHGPEFTATALALWRCYLPGFDFEKARMQGMAHGIRFAAPPPDRKVLHWADGPCCLCGTKPPDPRWHSVSDIPFGNADVRDEVLSYSTETARLRRIFELELEQPGTVVVGQFNSLLRQIKAGALLPDGHPLRDHIRQPTSPRRYDALAPGPRRTWVRDALKLLDD